MVSHKPWLEAIIDPEEDNDPKKCFGQIGTLFCSSLFHGGELSVNFANQAGDPIGSGFGS
jgi:hypothetical protein